MSYYLEPDSHIRDKAKVVLDLPNYATKKELKDGTIANTANLPAKRDFIALKAEIDRIVITKLANVSDFFE